MLALFLTILIHVMTMLGTIMSMQMGLAMAVMNDPAVAIGDRIRAAQALLAAPPA